NYEVNHIVPLSMCVVPNLLLCNFDMRPSWFLIRQHPSWHFATFVRRLEAKVKKTGHCDLSIHVRNLDFSSPLQRLSFEKGDEKIAPDCKMRGSISKREVWEQLKANGFVT